MANGGDMSFRRAPAVLLSVVLLAAACGNGGGSSGSPGESAGNGGTAGDAAGDVTGDGGRAERETKVQSDAEGLQPLLNAFWTQELQDLYGIPYDPPDQLNYYRGSDNPPCGLTAFEGSKNAYYCPVDSNEFVAYDLDWLQEYLIDFPGGATTFMVIAHEWGHSVQDAWLESGGSDFWDPPYRKELDADCLAGVFLRRKIDSGEIEEEVGDADAIFSWLYSGGSGTWLDPGDHGTQEQRQTAFSDGFIQGTAYCRTNY